MPWTSIHETDTNEAVRLEPGNARYWYLLGRSYQYDFDQPDPNAALRAFLASRSLDPLSADTLLDLATNYDETGRVPRRVQHISKRSAFILSPLKSSGATEIFSSGRMRLILLSRKFVVR